MQASDCIQVCGAASLTDRDPVTTSALIIAAVALIVALGQLLQQIFSTAEGHRRCQPSVIGHWSRRTRRRWRWSQFRFETIFETPHFGLAPVVSQESLVTEIIGNQCLSTTGSLWSRFHYDRDAYLVPTPGEPCLGRLQLCSWLALCETLHQYNSTACVTSPQGIHWRTECIPKQITMPTVQPCRWSWDLMPPDVFRPLASLHLGTLIILAHRMGLVWRVLRPAEGVVQAEGNSQSISGTPVRGLGMVIHYDREATAALDVGLDAALAQTYKWIPTTEADKMGFGIIPGGELCNHIDLKFGQDSTSSVKPGLDVDVIFPRLINLGITRRACNHLRAIVKESDVRLPGLGDVPGIWCDFLPAAPSNNAAIIHPMRRRPLTPLVMQSPSVWYQFLTQSPSKDCWVSDIFEQLSSYNPAELRRLRKTNWRDIHWFLRPLFRRTTDHFQGLRHRFGDDFYLNLVVAHLNMAIFQEEDAEKYVANIHEMSQELLERHPNCSVREAEDAWWVMIARGILWYMSNIRHANVPTVPSYYWNSKTLVYIS